jgi:hypothetical protein
MTNDQTAMLKIKAFLILHLPLPWGRPVPLPCLGAPSHATWYRKVADRTDEEAKEDQHFSDIFIGSTI